MRQKKKNQVSWMTVAYIAFKDCFNDIHLKYLKYLFCMRKSNYEDQHLLNILSKTFRSKEMIICSLDSKPLLASDTIIDGGVTGDLDYSFFYKFCHFDCQLSLLLLLFTLLLTLILVTAVIIDGVVASDLDYSFHYYYHYGLRFLY